MVVPAGPGVVRCCASAVGRPLSPGAVRQPQTAQSDRFGPTRAGTAGPGVLGAVTDQPKGKDWVAVILALGIATGLNCITFAVLYDAIFSDQSGLSENATQILTGAFGGILGVLGSYVGYQAANRSTEIQHSIDQPGPSVVESKSEAPDPSSQPPSLDQ